MLCSLLAAALAAPAQAGELFGGLYVHDVKTADSTRAGSKAAPTSARLSRRRASAHTPLQPYVFGALNTAGDTSYAAVGLSAKFGKRIYIRPGLGIAIHNGSAEQISDPPTTRSPSAAACCSSPSSAIGAQVNGRLSVEASWVHMSHAQLFGRENPGIDNLGVRLNLAL